MRPSVTALFHSQKALFEEGVFTSVSRGAGPAFAEAEEWLCSRGSLSRRPLSGFQKPVLRSFPPLREGATLRLSFSEEIDTEGVDELAVA